jgi:hypothetical protein
MKAIGVGLFACALVLAAGGVRGAVPVDSVSTPEAADSVRSLRTAPAPAHPEAAAKERAAREERERLKETLDLMGRSEVAGERRWQRHKSGKVAMLSSAVLPGLGQVYNGRRIKVAVMVGVASGYFSQIWLNNQASQRARSLRDRLDPGTSKWDLQNRLIEFYDDEAVTWIWWSGAVWIIGILDAWTDAHLYDIRVFTPPAHDEPADASLMVPGGEPTRYLTLTIEF